MVESLQKGQEELQTSYNLQHEKLQKQDEKLQKQAALIEKLHVEKNMAKLALCLFLAKPSATVAAVLNCILGIGIAVGTHVQALLVRVRENLTNLTLGPCGRAATAWCRRRRKALAMYSIAGSQMCK
ncbi:hypothetical protein HYH02_000531 [Chlamydomonas schloesseri]|uniref:Uncharacterized protein n=1 Tax=Chlamydomonas schloesseri TaxID=2026947 RepID=A0A835WUT5_9CHLO|nr:hypothetical protein HYH02_000531 [Chlamydomonas schloesseri]|eukprot:KAG2454694.1 hypothetical protein HYH02_000531 [Chlamydomonas schloesseri]